MTLSVEGNRRHFPYRESRMKNCPPAKDVTIAPAERISHLQHLRAIAALMVLLQHSQFLHHPSWIGSVFGGLGIDLFFVISGFVIFWVTRNETSFRRYLLRRIIRIVPLYWMLTLLMAALVLLAPQLFRQTAFDLLHFIQSLAFIPSFNSSRPDEITPLLPPGWTLNYEFFFYLSFGLVFFLPATRPFRLAILTALFLALVIAGKIVAPAGAIGQIYTSGKLLEFLAGVWIGEVSEVLRMLDKDGWFLVATRGSHRQFKHSTKAGRVTVPGKPSDDLAPGTLNSILKQSGLKK